LCPNPARLQWRDQIRFNLRGKREAGWIPSYSRVCSQAEFKKVYRTQGVGHLQKFQKRLDEKGAFVQLRLAF